jgi:hypothetical protein
MALPRISWMPVFFLAGLGLAAWRAWVPPQLWVAGRTMEQEPEAVALRNLGLGPDWNTRLVVTFQEHQGALFAVRRALSFAEPHRPMTLTVATELRRPLPVGVYHFDSEGHTDRQIVSIGVSDNQRPPASMRVVGDLRVDCATPAALAGHLTLEAVGVPTEDRPTDWSGHGPVINRKTGSLEAELSLPIQSAFREPGLGCQTSADCCGLPCEAHRCVGAPNEAAVTDSY